MNQEQRPNVTDHPDGSTTIWLPMNNTEQRELLQRFVETMKRNSAAIAEDFGVQPQVPGDIVTMKSAKQLLDEMKDDNFTQVCYEHTFGEPDKFSDLAMIEFAETYARMVAGEQVKLCAQHFKLVGFEGDGMPHAPYIDPVSITTCPRIGVDI